MTAISQHIQDVKRRLAQHAESYPRESDTIRHREWGQEFDSLRADLDRLKYAEANPVITSGVEPLRM